MLHAVVVFLGLAVDSLNVCGAVRDTVAGYSLQQNILGPGPKASWVVKRQVGGWCEEALFGFRLDLDASDDLGRRVVWSAIFGPVGSHLERGLFDFRRWLRAALL